MSDVAPLAYRVPPAPIAALIDAPELPDVALSPDRRWLLLLERPALPPIAELAEPELRLAGLRLNPRTNGPSRSSPYRSLALLPLPAGSGPARKTASRRTPRRPPSGARRPGRGRDHRPALVTGRGPDRLQRGRGDWTGPVGRGGGRAAPPGL